MIWIREPRQILVHQKNLETPKGGSWKREVIPLVNSSRLKSLLEDDECFVTPNK
jgi:hypothetical protein